MIEVKPDKSIGVKSSRIGYGVKARRWRKPEVKFSILYKLVGEW
jgi:hypothetical protein